jgi:hypothetical protein
MYLATWATIGIASANFQTTALPAKNANGRAAAESFPNPAADHVFVSTAEKGSSTRHPFSEIQTSPATPTDIRTSVRIGITRETHRPLRFYEAGSPFVSGPRSLN